MPTRLATSRYLSAGGVIVDPAHTRVMVLLRPGREGPDGRPEVRLPKGHIEDRETPLQAALREVSEEAGLANLEVVGDLGHQIVEFEWEGNHIIRDEAYFLMAVTPATLAGIPEKQFQRLWLTWEEALRRMTFEAEREWVRRARYSWEKRSG